MTTETGTADPIAQAWGAEDDDDCPKCGHGRTEERWNPFVSLGRRVGLTLKVRCSSYDGDDLSSLDCGCAHDFHQP